MPGTVQGVVQEGFSPPTFGQLGPTFDFRYERIHSRQWHAHKNMTFAKFLMQFQPLKGLKFQNFFQVSMPPYWRMQIHIHVHVCPPHFRMLDYLYVHVWDNGKLGWGCEHNIPKQYLQQLYLCFLCHLLLWLVAHPLFSPRQQDNQAAKTQQHRF